MAGRGSRIEQVQAVSASRRYPRSGATTANSLARMHDGDSLDIDMRGDGRRRRGDCREAKIRETDLRCWRYSDFRWSDGRNDGEWAKPPQRAPSPL